MMDFIELMVAEHRNIRRLLRVLRAACLSILDGQPMPHDDFGDMVDFIRTYADFHHHGKEERLLFVRMAEELGPAGVKLVRLGMNVEHDLGRLHVRELEAALQRVRDGETDARLDVIGHAMAYAHLLDRHIDKEDRIAYPYAEAHLSKESLAALEAACGDFEREAHGNGVQERCLARLRDLERKWGTGQREDPSAGYASA